ncbi:hypothetical protein BBJ28_00013982 [Nothophytophthora sp. Chile5]|nr:hypothetical protein BBJ28_00013982 [Nothophytophthora sp. Chile5]
MREDFDALPERSSHRRFGANRHGRASRMQASSGSRPMPGDGASRSATSEFSRAAERATGRTCVGLACFCRPLAFRMRTYLTLGLYVLLHLLAAMWMVVCRYHSNYHSNSWVEDEGHGVANNFDFGHDDRHYGSRAPPQPEVSGHAPPKYMKPRASGKSVMAPGSSIMVNDEKAVLNRVFKPPEKQNDFLAGITASNTAKNRGRRVTGTTSSSSSSLEVASAPTPKTREATSLPLGSSGWKNTRQPQGVPRQRVMLASTVKRLELRPSRPHDSPPVGGIATRLSKRTCNLRSSESGTASSTLPFTLRSTQSTTRLGKRKISTVGSAAEPIALDSDSESEAEAPTANVNTNGASDSGKPATKAREEKKASTVKLEEIEANSVDHIYDCDALIGLFQCVVDLFFQPDRVCMCKIRGKYEPWPFKPYYLLDYKHLQDVHIFRAGKETKAYDETESKESDRADQLLDEAAFIVIKCPLSEEADRIAMKSFYDPGDSEGSEDNVPVLTYPLPPCTSDIVTIIRQDVSRLKPKRYLNDNIIDYYFKRLMLKDFRADELIQEKVLFLSSHFYSRLRVGKGPTQAARMDAGYKNVSTWLSRSSFFSRSIIFIPINKEYVAESLPLPRRDCLVAALLICGVFDDDVVLFYVQFALESRSHFEPPTGGDRSDRRGMREFLRLEWQNSNERASGEEEDQSKALYSTDRVLAVNVKAPCQQNGYDCGVYVLKFAEVIVKNCLELGLLARNGGVIDKTVTDAKLEALISSSAFSAEDIAATRKQIRQYIADDAGEYQLLVEEKQQGKAAAGTRDALAAPVVLTEATFDHQTSEGVWFVKFYAPWCGHCKKLAPVIDEMSEDAQIVEKGVHVAKVDCTVEKSICERFGVQSYPTLRVVSAGKYYDYSGRREAPSMIAFATEGFKKEFAERVLSYSEFGTWLCQHEENERKSAVVSLTTASFEELVLNSKEPWLIKFYAPWFLDFVESGWESAEAIGPIPEEGFFSKIVDMSIEWATEHTVLAILAGILVIAIIVAILVALLDYWLGADDVAAYKNVQTMPPRAPSAKEAKKSGKKPKAE